MITRDDKLQIFEEFRVDRTLPKFQKPKSDQRSMSKSAFQGQASLDEDEVGEESGIFWSGNVVSVSSVSGISIQDLAVQQKIIRQQGWVLYLWFRLSSWFNKKAEPKPTMTVEQFFGSVKNSVEDLQIVQARAAGYESALKRAKESHQQALVEKLQAGLVSTRTETQLLTVGLRKFLTEETLVDFVKKCPKGLRLDWIANFTRVIPVELVERLKVLNERKLFDNYVILHYDPQVKSWAETNEEKARRKDPILFGVLTGSRKLYYIGDWVDEFCDLTLDQIVETLGGLQVVSEISTEFKV